MSEERSRYNPEDKPWYYLAVPELKKAVEDFVTDLQQRGLIQELKKEEAKVYQKIAAPVVPIPVSDGYDVAIDYSRLNSHQLTKDRYRLPDLREFVTKCSGHAKYSVLRLINADYQIRVGQEAITQTTFCCHLGLFKFLVIPKELAFTNGTIQELLDDFLKDCSFASAYVDQIVIHGEDQEECTQNTRQVLEIMREQKLYIDRKHCQWFTEQPQIMNYAFGKQGVTKI